MTASPFGFDENVQGIVLGSVLVFAAPETFQGTELWRSDGTPQGTGVLADIDPGDAGGSFPSNLTAVGSKRLLYCGVRRRDRRLEESLLPGPGDVNEVTMVWAGNRLFLYGTATDLGGGLFVWDGTPGNLRLLRGVGISQDPLYPLAAVASNGVLYFSGFDNTFQNTLWASDGTEAGNASGSRCLQPSRP